MPLRKIRRPKGAGPARSRGHDDVPTKSRRERRAQGAGRQGPPLGRPAGRTAPEKGGGPVEGPRGSGRGPRGPSTRRPLGAATGAPPAPAVQGGGQGRRAGITRGGYS